MMNPKLYFAFALAVAFLIAHATGTAVRDVDGDLLRPGVGYYVLPVLRGHGGGLTLAGRGSELCPLDIVQENSEVDDGIPVKFSGWTSRVGFVPESEDLNIKTDVAATICIQSTYWWIDEFDKQRKQWFVTTGNALRRSGKESLRSFFKIVKSRNDYKFVFCPRDCEFCRPICGDVGIFVDENGIRRLALSDQPFVVMFKKATKETESVSKTV
ncbi:PREDICTED: miraculin-like [Tarenaya hassleriana]|uniref:miraculin-like n=1 Tax=Tarenaya hassleriana TaxID=28532 RepID=UPI00053C97D0|nr:PREDICTED: miraculin-like [Tarenaya hassleriana]